MLVYGSLCGNITYAYGVFLPSMGESFGWSRSALSGPYTLFFIIGGLLGPAAGISNARFGPRRNILFFNLLAAAGLFGMSKVTAIWHVYLFFGVIVGTVIAFGEFIPITSVVNNWFIRRRSLAMGFLFAAGGLGGFVMPPAISWLISEYGWPRAWQFLAGLHLVTAVVAAALLIRNQPEDLGQQPDGVDRAPAASIPDAHAAGTPAGAGDWRVGEAMRSRALWIIVALFSIILFTTNVLSTHQVAYLQDAGFSPIASAAALGMMLGFSIIGRLLSGVLGMRCDGRRLAVCFLACIGGGILFLMHAGSIHFIYGYSILTGIGFGGMIVLIPHLLGTYFGRTHYVRIIGWTAPVVTFFSAAGPVLAGALYDTRGNYDLALATTAALIAAGILLGMTMPPASAKPSKP
jgi:MFS family permease